MAYIGDLVRLKDGGPDEGVVINSDNQGAASSLLSVHWISTNLVSKERVHALQVVDREVVVGDVVRSADGKHGMVTQLHAKLDVLLNTHDVSKEFVKDVGPRKLRPASRLHVGQWVTMEGWLGCINALFFDIVVRLFYQGREYEGELTAVSTEDLTPLLAVDKRRSTLYTGQPVRAPKATTWSAIKWAKNGCPPSCAEHTEVELVVVDPILLHASVAWLTQAGSFSAPPQSILDATQPIPLSQPAKPKWLIGDAVQFVDKFDSHSALICSKRTFVDVLWQDATTASKLPSTSISVVTPEDTDNLVLPGDYMRLARDQHELLVVLGSGEANVLLAPCERCEARPLIEAIEDLIPDESLSFRAGDVVMRQHTENSGFENYESEKQCIANLGEVISMQPDGVHVLWVNGKRSTIKPWLLHLIACPS